MKNIQIRPPAWEYLVRIARHMNPLDVQEVWASRGLPPLQALEESVEVSYSTRVAVIDGEAQVAFGIATSSDGRVGVPWMLATPEISQWRMRFLSMSAEVMHRWKVDHELLTNYTDARHVQAHRWLKWLGFQFVELKEQFGYEQIPFWRFECVTRQ